MITHLVLLTPRADLTAPERLAFIEAFQRAVSEVSQIRRVRIGRRLRHGASYEAAAPPLTFAALIDFDDLPSLQAYLQHPAHAQLGTLFGGAVAAALVFDYEVGGIEQLAELAAVNDASEGVRAPPV